MCTFFTNGRDVAGRLVAAHLADPAAAQRREAAKHTPNSDTGPPSLPRAAALPRTGEPPPSSYSLARPPLPSAAVARGVTGQSPCGVAATAVFSSDRDLVGRRRSFLARSAATWKWCVRRRRWRTAPAMADLALTGYFVVLPIAIAVSGALLLDLIYNTRMFGAPALGLLVVAFFFVGVGRPAGCARMVMAVEVAVAGGLAGRRRRNMAGGSGNVLSGSRGGGPGGWRPVKLGLSAAAWRGAVPVQGGSVTTI